MDERTTIDQLIDEIESEQDAHPDQVGSALMQALSVRDVAVQRVALGSLPRGAANNPRWRAYVQDAMASKDSLVRCEAAEAAGRLRLSEAVPALMRLLRDPRSLVRVCAVEALWDLDAREAAPIITEMLVGDRNWIVRGYAAGALADLSGQAALPVLRARLSEERNRWARLQVMLALYTLGEKAMFSHLLRALKSRDLRLSMSIANSIQSIVDETNCHPLLAALSDALQREQTVAGQEALSRAAAYVQEVCRRNTQCGPFPS